MATKEDSGILRSWIYKLSKDVLANELLERGLQAHGTVDEMRKRLSGHLKERNSPSV